MFRNTQVAILCGLVALFASTSPAYAQSTPRGGPFSPLPGVKTALARYNGNAMRFPRIFLSNSGLRYVWAEPTASRTYVRFHATGVIWNMDLARETYNPDVWGQSAVAEFDGVNGRDVLRKDLGGGGNTLLNAANKDERYPSIHSDNGAWQSADVPPGTFYKGNAYPAGGPLAPFNAPMGQVLRPQIWSDFIAYHNSFDDVMLYKWTLPTADLILAGTGSPERHAHIHENRVSWQGGARSEIYFSDITSGLATPITATVPALLNTPDDNVCAGYKWRPRVGGDGRYIIYRGMNCKFDAATVALFVAAGINNIVANQVYGQVLWLTYLNPTTGHQKIYFVSLLGTDQPENFGTEYDIHLDQLIWSDNIDLFLFDINEAAL